MGKRFVCASFVFMVAACGSSGGNKNADAKQPDGPSIDAKVFMDAPGPFSCYGDSAPTTANATVTFSGTVSEVSGLSAPAGVSGASVTACTGDCMNANNLGNTSSMSGGTFSLGNVSTGGTPLNAYLDITYMTDLEVFAYAGAPVVADVSNVPAITFTQGVLQLAKDDGCNITTQGFLVILLTDCTDTRITDSKASDLSVKQNGTTVAGTKTIDLGSLNSAAAGIFLVCNVPAGTTTVGATYNSMTFLSHDVNVKAVAATETEVRPGY